MRITINPDEVVVKKIRTELKENEGYCPCQLIKNKDTKCICKEFQQQDHEGECYCGLYVKVK